jgi:hypothetical protein
MSDELPSVMRLRAWAPMIASGYECPAASTAMITAADLIEKLTEAFEKIVACAPDDFGPTGPDGERMVWIAKEAIELARERVFTK